MQLHASKIIQVMLYQQKREADASRENTRFTREHNSFARERKYLCERTQIFFARERKYLCEGTQSFSRERKYICERTQRFCEGTQSFSRERKYLCERTQRFCEGTQSFSRERKTLENIFSSYPEFVPLPCPLKGSVPFKAKCLKLNIYCTLQRFFQINAVLLNYLLIKDS